MFINIIKSKNFRLIIYVGCAMIATDLVLENNELIQNKLINKYPGSILYMIYPSNKLIRSALERDPELFTRIQQSRITQDLREEFLIAHPDMLDKIPKSFDTFITHRNVWKFILCNYKFPKTEINFRNIISIIAI